jgi:hypothetical protein
MIAAAFVDEGGRFCLKGIVYKSKSKHMSSVS